MVLTVRIAAALGAAAMFAGCGAAPANTMFAMRYEKGWEKTDLDRLISRGGQREVSVTTLGNTAWVSHHVAVVRTEEKPHYHRFHDLTVTVLRGEGVLNVGTRAIRMKPGDVAHVHRGTPHFFRNTGEEPAAAFVVFSPPFDGRDTVTAKEEKKDGAGEGAGKPKKKSGWFW